MRKLFFILLIVIVLLTGCSRDGEKSDLLGDRFKEVEYGGEWIIFVDNETGVLYLRDTTTYMGGITVLLNEDGTPMLLDTED